MPSWTRSACVPLCLAALMAGCPSPTGPVSEQKLSLNDVAAKGRTPLPVRSGASGATPDRAGVLAEPPRPAGTAAAGEGGGTAGPAPSATAGAGTLPTFASCVPIAAGQVGTIADRDSGLIQASGVATGPDGTLYVAGYRSQRLYQLMPGSGCAWRIGVLAGDGVNGFQDGPGAQARFNDPRGLVVDAAGRWLYVADYSNNRIRRVDLKAADHPVETFTGFAEGGYQDGPAATARFDHPAGLALDADDVLLVADSGNHRIRAVDVAGAVRTLAGGNEGAGPDQFNNPMGLWLRRGATPPGASSPPGAAPADVFVADTGNHRIVKVARPAAGSSAPPALTVVAGDPVPGFRDGVGQAAAFREPVAVLDDDDGMLVLDSKNHALRRLTNLDGAQAIVVTVAGDSATGVQDGPLAQARFRYPLGLARAADGAIVVADGDNDRVRLIRR